MEESAATGQRYPIAYHTSRNEHESQMTYPLLLIAENMSEKSDDSLVLIKGYLQRQATSSNYFDT